MSGIIRSTDWWWQYFKNLFHIKNYYVSGTITAASGFHEIEVISDFSNPIAVYLNTEEPDDGTTTCVGDLNWTSAKMNLNGFTLYANIKSNTCTIKYVIEYSNDNNNPNNPNNPIVVDNL